MENNFATNVNDALQYSPVVQNVSTNAHDFNGSFDLRGFATNAYSIDGLNESLINEDVATEDKERAEIFQRFDGLPLRRCVHR